MERETGIEPATNSLEGCDSTTELLPPTLKCCFGDVAGAKAPFAVTYIGGTEVPPFRNYRMAEAMPFRPMVEDD